MGRHTATAAEVVRHTDSACCGRSLYRRGVLHTPLSDDLGCIYIFDVGNGRSNNSVCRMATVAGYADMKPNPAVDPVRFALWTLRDKAAQRRSP